MSYSCFTSILTGKMVLSGIKLDNNIRSAILTGDLCYIEELELLTCGADPCNDDVILNTWVEACDAE